MIFTIEIDKYIVRCKYWPAEPENGVPADVEILKLWKIYGDRKFELSYEESWRIDERKLLQKVEELLLKESRDTSDVGSGFNAYNPHGGEYETR